MVCQATKESAARREWHVVRFEHRLNRNVLAGVAVDSRSKPPQQLVKVGGKRRLEPKRSTVERMSKSEPIRVECLPRECNRRRAVIFHIEPFTNQWMIVQERLHPNLIAFPGV